MPTYDFHCDQCKKDFEKLVSIGKKHAPCPSCGKKSDKKISVPSIIFKGSGFYKTDSRPTESKKAPEKKTEKKKKDTPSKSV